MKVDRLAAPARAFLALGALLMLAFASMLQCPALAVGDTAREALTLLGLAVSLLCISVLIEDLLAAPLRAALRLTAAARAAA
jgi:hypothetical protein